MCGFLAHISLKKNINQKTFERGLKTLEQRGPDSKNIICTNRYFFGHQRLKIIDLTEAASQPMQSICGRYLITFNGEIYNYKKIRKELELTFKSWKSKSDTEVILNAYIKWGFVCLQKFEGIFSFVIFDKVEQKVFAARDRLGVKPLYYEFNSAGITLASRPRAIFTLKNKRINLNQDALNLYLSAGYIPAPYSIYDSVSQLKAGTFLYLDSSMRLEVREWWNPHQYYPNKSLNLTQNELIEKLENTFIKSIEHRLVSDVPVGVFLSGGLDSSIISALTAKMVNGKINTYSIGFQDSNFDESVFSKEVSEHINSNHFLEILKPNDLLNLIPYFEKNFDEPFSDVACFPTMALARLVSNNHKVVLSGDGGDELFGGYHYYKIINKMKFFYQLPIDIRNLLGNCIACLPFHKTKLFSESIKKNNIIDSFAFMRSISKDFLVLNEKNKFEEMYFNSYKKMPKTLLIEEIASRLDLMHTLGDGYLQKLDISTMAFSVEAREPFLDSEMVKFCLELPWNYKINNGVTKYLLKKLAEKYLPQHIVYRKKSGFEVPIGNWLNNELREWSLDKIESKNLFLDLPFSQQHVKNMYKVHKCGIRNVTPFLWNILVLLNFIDLN